MIRIRFVFCSVVIASLILAILISTAPVQAQTDPFEIYVTDFRDLDDIDYADEICDSDPVDHDQCTLRAAISTANAYNGESDLVYIHLPAGTFTLTLPKQSEDTNSGGDLDIDNPAKSILLEGDSSNYPIINGNKLDRVLTNFNSAYSLELRYLIITGGALDSKDGGLTGGGILNFGDLTLNGIVVKDNQVVCSNPAHNCDNMIGGGIINYDKLYITDSTIQGNYAWRGGGLFNVGGDHVSDIFNTTFKDNRAMSGGAITNYSFLHIVNSTVSGNIGESGVGGIDNNGVIELASVTIADNNAPAGAVNLSSDSSSVMRNTIISSSLGKRNCSFITQPLSLGFNLSSDGTCGFDPLLSDQINTDPRLSPLGNWGGFSSGQVTWTHGLLVGSPAINAGNPAGCSNIFSGGVPLTYDQRGQPRYPGRCDIGAFEGSLTQVFLPLIRR